MKALKITSVVVVLAVFLSALTVGWLADTLPAGTQQSERLGALSMSGMILTLVLGIAVGFFWVFWNRSHDDRSSRR